MQAQQLDAEWQHLTKLATQLQQQHVAASSQLQDQMEKRKRAQSRVSNLMHKVDTAEGTQGGSLALHKAVQLSQMRSLIKTLVEGLVALQSAHPDVPIGQAMAAAGLKPVARSQSGSRRASRSASTASSLYTDTSSAASSVLG